MRLPVAPLGQELYWCVMAIELLPVSGAVSAPLVESQILSVFHPGNRERDLLFLHRAPIFQPDLYTCGAIAPASLIKDPLKQMRVGIDEIAFGREPLAPAPGGFTEMLSPSATLNTS